MSEVPALAPGPAPAAQPAPAPPRPLAGKRVLDLSQFIAGPTAAMYLADYGAEVTKVEPARGDGSRTLSGNRFGSYYTRSFNTGKQSQVLDLRDVAERATFDTLLAEADAFICNLAPGSLQALGLEGATLRANHPQLVIVLISGYGQQDARICMDTIAQCESGFALLNAHQDGTPRISTGWPVDMFSGLYAGMSCAMALLDPRRSGCLIDLSMLEVAAAMMVGPQALTVAEGDALGPPTGNSDRASTPSGIYRCADGYVYILGGVDHYWARLRPLVGGAQSTIDERIARGEEYDALVEAWTATRTRDDILATMQALQIPAGNVRTPEDALDRIRAMRPGAVSQALASGEHVPAVPALFDGQRLPRTAAPQLGGGRRVDRDSEGA